MPRRALQRPLGGLVVAFLGLSFFDEAFVAKVFFNTSGRLERGSVSDSSDSPGCLVPVYRGLCLVRKAPSSETLEPVLLSELPEIPGFEGQLLAWLGRPSSGPLLELQQRALRKDAGKGFWLLDLSASAEAPEGSLLGAEGEWSKLRSRSGPSVLDALAADDYAALLSTAVGLSEWHRSVPFCAKCGGRTCLREMQVRMYHVSTSVIKAFTGFETSSKRPAPATCTSKHGRYPHYPPVPAPPPQQLQCVECCRLRQALAFAPPPPPKNSASAALKLKKCRSSHQDWEFRKSWEASFFLALH